MAKTHQIRFRLGLRPRPRWGSLQRSARPPSWISEVLLLTGGRGREDEERRGKEEGGDWKRRVGEGKGRERKGKAREREEGREREGRREREGPPIISHTPSFGFLEICHDVVLSEI